MHFEKIRSVTELPLICPACGSHVADIGYRYFDDSGGNAGESLFYSCRNCSFLFARPVLIPELNNRQMDGVDDAEMFNSELMKWLYIKLFLKREIATLRRLTGNKSECRLLDIGCGTGWTTKVFRDHGFKVTGLEPSAIRAQIARERYGLDVVSDYLENLSESVGSYDVIVLHHVIEHFAEPDAIMEKVHELLACNGIVVVLIPNINCLGRYLFETDWTWGLPWHCNFFTPKSISAIFERVGFRVELLSHIPSPYYFPASLLRTIGNTTLTKFAARHSVATKLVFAPVAVVGAMLGLGDNLNLFARKENL